MTVKKLRVAGEVAIAAVYLPACFVMILCYVTPLSVLTGRVRHWIEYPLAGVGVALWALLAVGLAWAL